jgi:hypothetical protein
MMEIPRPPKPARTRNAAPEPQGRLRRRSYAALLAGAREVRPHAEYDQRGYAARWQDNVLDGLPVADITSDFGTGAGRELDGKLCAAHSSAALVVNAFGPWRTHPASLRIAGVTGFRAVRFERRLPTGLGGTPPHLDLLAEGDAVVAVESKCTEWMGGKPAVFAPSYDGLQRSLGTSPWFELMQELRAEPDRYRFLDAAQLVKHAFGLLIRFGSKEVRLVYVYWEPANRDHWPACRRHREEAAELGEKVATSNVRLVPMSYHDLWAEWELAGAPAHLPLLKTRYGRTA